jgi:hypothetical protein
MMILLRKRRDREGCVRAAFDAQGAIALGLKHAAKEERAAVAHFFAARGHRVAESLPSPGRHAALAGPSLFGACR